MSESAICSMPRRRWIERFFPSRGFERDAIDTRTYLRTHVQLHLDWTDRLRLLVSGIADVKITTYTDVEVKDATSLSSFSVLAPHSSFWSRRHAT